LLEQEAKAQEAWVTAQNGEDFKLKMETMQRDLAQLRQTRLAAVSRVQQQRALLDRVSSLMLPAWTVILAGTLVLLVVLAIRRSLPRALPYYALAAVCSLLIVGLASLY